MRPLRQSSRLSSVCALLICSRELAGTNAEAAATDGGRAGASAALMVVCAKWCMRPRATAFAGSAASEIAIVAAQARRRISQPPQFLHRHQPIFDKLTLDFGFWKYDCRAVASTRVRRFRTCRGRSRAWSPRRHGAYIATLRL